MNIFSDGIGQLLTSMSTREEGLTSWEAERKQMAYGKNQLPEKQKNLWKMFAKEFSNPLILILIASAAILLTISYLETQEFHAHHFIEPGVILLVVFLNAGIGFFQEWKSENTISALKNLQPSFSTVLRDGEKKQIRSEDLVPGDIIFISEGEKIAADIRLIEAIDCKTNESMLTGESIPVEKFTYPPDTEGGNMLFSGSILLAGRAKGVVVAIGQKTKLGSIATLVNTIESPKTPLEKKIESFSKSIGKIMLGICGIIFLGTLLEGLPLADAFITAVALAVASIPEGLPVVVTLALSFGVAFMARRQMLVRELKSIESLGNITVIASDKTGTITQNKMSVQKIFANEKIFLGETLHNAPQKIIQAGWYCNDATLPSIGDPTEIALLEFAKRYEFESSERIDEIPFSSERKWMSTTQLVNGEMTTFIKGAPEMVAKEFLKNAEEYLSAAETMAAEGLRTLMMVAKTESSEHYECLGIVGLQDPPREGVKNAIQIAKHAGIRTIMITGDHAVTAKAIAQQVGIEGDLIEGKELESLDDIQLQHILQTASIFARVTPTHKVRICKALQANNEVVAMTGDGVNDAPALKQAEVGIAMGKVGTDVSRSASDMIVLDDDFSSIVSGIEEGRRIFANIKKSILFLLSTNMAEIIVFVLGVAFSTPLPLVAIQILFINLITDSFPALALSMEKADPNTMKQPPSPVSENIFGGMLKKLILISALVGGMVFVGFMMILQNTNNLQTAQTFAFALLSFLEMAVVLSIRSNEMIFVAPANAWLWGGVSVSLLLTIGLIHSPVSHFLSLQPLSAIQWGIISGMSLLFITVLEIVKWKKL